MEKLIFGTGLKRYEVNDNGAIFSFNPTDINLYSRFLKMRDEILKIGEKIEKLGDSNNLTEEGFADHFVAVFDEADKLGKKALTECFGKENDFDAIFDGANIFTLTDTGNWVITNFIEAITPVVEKEVSTFIKEKAKRKASQVKHNKAKRANK